MNSFPEFLITRQSKKSCAGSIQSLKFLFLEGHFSQSRLYRDCRGFIWGDCKEIPGCCT